MSKHDFIEPPCAIHPAADALARPVFQLTHRRECYHCKKPNPPKRCGACQVARYCNVECQRQHRAEHRTGCRRQMDATGSLTPHNAKKIHVGSAFLDFWRSPLVRWAVHHINLGAREEDFLVECTFMALFAVRENPPSSSKKFAYELGSCGMIRDDNIREAMHSVCTPDMVDLVMHRHSELPKNIFLIRFLVGTGSIWTCYAIDIHTVFDDYDFAGWNVLTALMARYFETGLAQAILDGNDKYCACMEERDFKGINRRTTIESSMASALPATRRSSAVVPLIFFFQAGVDQVEVGVDREQEIPTTPCPVRDFASTPPTSCSLIVTGLCTSTQQVGSKDAPGDVRWSRRTEVDGNNWEIIVTYEQNTEMLHDFRIADYLHWLPAHRGQPANIVVVRALLRLKLNLLTLLESSDTGVKVKEWILQPTRISRCYRHLARGRHGRRASPAEIQSVIDLTGEDDANPPEGAPVRTQVIDLTNDEDTEEGTLEDVHILSQV
uniref:MYND-type domain-containing protein n=1 Tax=Mycena chlorophos TaxID=658473 RepID=A0ABQ0LGC0_MYCCL|nr:predicted protein [Mycena chlorophos]